jgi:FMN reductase
MCEMGTMPTVVGLGGTMRAGSSSEQALRYAMECIKEQGLNTVLLTGEELMLPMYDPSSKQGTLRSAHIVDLLRRAAGVIIASPCYHGSVSGLIKNSLDYMEETAVDPRPYLDGKAVGLIGCGFGNQGPTMVLSQLRSITHSLRGWPVPMGVAINTAVAKFDGGSWNDENVGNQLSIMAHQVVKFVQLSANRRQADGKANA